MSPIELPVNGGGGVGVCHVGGNVLTCSKSECDGLGGVWSPAGGGGGNGKGKCWAAAELAEELRRSPSPPSRLALSSTTLQIDELRRVLFDRYALGRELLAVEQEHANALVAPAEANEELRSSMFEAAGTVLTFTQLLLAEQQGFGGGEQPARYTEQLHSKLRSLLGELDRAGADKSSVEAYGRVLDRLQPCVGMTAAEFLEALERDR